MDNIIFIGKDNYILVENYSRRESNIWNDASVIETIDFTIEKTEKEKNSRGLTSLYALMIIDILRRHKKPLGLQAIISIMQYEFGHILVAETVDAATLKRYLDDLSKCNLLSFSVKKTKLAGGVESYYLEKNNNIKNCTSKIPGRLKPAVIYDFLVRNRGAAFSADEISAALGKAVSAKTVRSTLRDNSIYTESIKNFGFEINIDEYTAKSGKTVEKYAAETGRYVCPDCYEGDAC